MVKLAPMNGVNVCKHVFAPNMDVFTTCFNFQTIYQVGGLQWVVTTRTHQEMR